MRILCTPFFTLAVIINFSEFSSQTSEDLRRGAAPSPSSPFAAEQRSPDPSSPERASLRARSRSPAGTPPTIRILGYSLRELGYIRLIPRKNVTLQFEFRRYCFPVGKQIRLRSENNRRVPVPTQESIVLSLSNGDVLAILDHSGFLIALYRADKFHRRVKISMMSGEVENLTRDEIKNCPVGKNHPILPRNFDKTFANVDSLQSVWNQHSERQESPLRRPSARYLPGRFPSDQVLGCALRLLGHVRLIPLKNREQRFEFRRYVFPADEKIRVRIDHFTYSLEPNQEYLVLSKSNGEVHAILDSSEHLRGIYKTDRHHSRVKIDMTTREVIIMTPEEMQVCPVGKMYPIFPNNSIKDSDNHDSLQTAWNSHGGVNSNPYPPARQQ